MFIILHSTCTWLLRHGFILALFIVSFSGLQAATVSWQGTVDNDWNNPLNWNTGAVPTIGDLALISTISGSEPYPVISAIALTVSQIEINDNATLTIANGGSITVEGTGCAGCAGLRVRPHAHLVVATGGSLTIQNTEDYGLHNTKGDITNDGDITITNTGDDPWYNYSNNTNAAIIDIINNGTISINTGVGNGIYNQLQKDTLLFTNNGTINIDMPTSNGIHNYAQNDSAYIHFVNGNAGIIHISNTGDHGIRNECRPNTAIAAAALTLENYGVITMETIDNNGIHNYHRGGTATTINHLNALISIQNVDDRGIFNDGSNSGGYDYAYAFSFDNYGNIVVNNSRLSGVFTQIQNDSGTFTNHANANIHTRNTGREGMYFYTNNNNTSLTVLNEGNITIDSSGYLNTYYRSGLYIRSRCYQSGDTTAHTYFTNNGSISIDSTTYHGMYNLADGGRVIWENNGSIAINNTHERGLYSLASHDGTGNDGGYLLFDNYGSIAVTDANTHGIFHYSQRIPLAHTDHASSTVTINNVLSSDGLRYSADLGGHVMYVNDAPININAINRQGIYSSNNNGGLIDITHNAAVNIDNCAQNGIYFANTNGELNLQVNAPITITNIASDGIYLENTRSNGGIFSTKINVQNNSIVTIDNVGDDGWQSYSARDTTTIINDGTIVITNVVDHGLVNNPDEFEGVITFTNNNNGLQITAPGSKGVNNVSSDGAYLNFVNNAALTITGANNEGILNSANGIIDFTNNAPIMISDIANRGFYNITNNANGIAGLLNFVNNSTMNITNCVDACWYQYARDGVINFTNSANAQITLDDTDDEAGFYNLMRQEDDTFETELNWWNYGTLNISNSVEHGLIFNYQNGTGVAENHAAININDVGYVGLYHYIHYDDVAYPVTGQFDNFGDITVLNTGERGMYNYTWKDTLTVTNHGTIDIDNTNWQGVFNYADNDEALLNFTNNGTFTIDNSNSEGFYNQAKQVTSTINAEVNCVNNGTISINTTAYEGFQNYAQRGTVNVTNSTGATINIANVGEDGIENYCLEDQAGFSAALTFINDGLLTIDSTAYVGLFNNLNRGDNLSFINNGALSIFETDKKGIQNYTTNSDTLTYADNVLNFVNTGTIGIDSTREEGIQNYTNKGDVINFTSSGDISIARTNREGMFNYSRPNGAYNVAINVDLTGGTLTIDQTTESGIYNLSDPHASGQSAIVFNNNATVNISNTTEYGLYSLAYRNNTAVNFHNQADGAINLQNAGLYAMYNRIERNDPAQVNSFMLVNDGAINVSNNNTVGIYNYTYRARNFSFANNGTIQFEGLNDIGLYNDLYSNSSGYPAPTFDFTNAGTISANNMNAKPIYNYNYNGWFNLDNTGVIAIDGSAAEGMQTLSISTNDIFAVQTNFTNSGLIDIANTAHEGVKNAGFGGTFVVVNDGVIKSNQTGREGIENVNYLDTLSFTNNGEIYLYDNGFEALYNTNHANEPFMFTNSTCALISTNGRIKNYYNTPLTNNGLIIADYVGAHSNRSDFVNNGLIESNGDFTASTTTVLNNADIVPTIVVAPVRFCEGQIISPALSDDHGVYTINNWYIDDTQTTIAGTFDANSNTFTPASSLPLGNNTFYVNLTDNTTGCTWLRAIDILIELPPSINNPQGTGQICESATIPTLSVEDLGSPFEYYWYDAPTGGNLLHTGATYTPNITTTGTYDYYVEAINTFNGCATPSREWLSVTMNPAAPDAVPVNSNVEVCEGTNGIDLMVQDAGANYTYNWYDNPTANVALATGTTFMATDAAPGTYTYYVDVQDATTSCVSYNREAITVTIYPAPFSPTVSPSNSSICANEPIPTFTINNTSSVYTYNWYANETDTTPISTGITYNPPIDNSVTASYTYYVGAVVNAFGCESIVRTPVNIQVNAVAPPPTTTTNMYSICEDEVLPTLSVNAEVGVVYEWYNATTNALVFTGTDYTPAALGIGTYDYLVRAIHATTNCVNDTELNMSLQINAVPNTPVPMATSYNINYGNTTPTFSVQDEGGTVGYNWYDAPSGGAVLATGTSYTPSVSAIGSYTYYVEAVNAASNCLNTNVVAINLSITEAPHVIAQAKLWLEGAYDVGTASMHTGLQDNGLLPNAQPFNTAPWNYTGNESVDDFAALAPNIVDWVLVEIRSVGDNTLIEEQRAALLLSDGSLMDVTGVTGVKFYSINTNTSHYLSVKMRNHLAIISSSYFNLPNPIVYDFTNVARVAGGASQVTLVNPNTYACRAGDFNSDGIISVADFNFYVGQAAQINQYIDGDCTLDGHVTTADFNAYLPNASVIGVWAIRY